MLVVGCGRGRAVAVRARRRRVNLRCVGSSTVFSHPTAHIYAQHAHVHVGFLHVVHDRVSCVWSLRWLGRCFFGTTDQGVQHTVCHVPCVRPQRPATVMLQKSCELQLYLNLYCTLSYYLYTLYRYLAVAPTPSRTRGLFGFTVYDLQYAFRNSYTLYICSCFLYDS